MTTEIATFTAVSGKEEALGQAMLHGLEAIRQHPEVIAARAERCVEKPGQYVLIVTWTSLEAHTVDFRGGPLFQQWRSHIKGLFEENPVVFHYEPFLKE